MNLVRGAERRRVEVATSATFGATFATFEGIPGLTSGPAVLEAVSGKPVESPPLTFWHDSLLSLSCSV